MEIASSVGLHKKDLRCRARVEVYRVTCGSERVRDGRASDAVPDGGYECDGDVAHDASFPIAFAPRDGGDRGLSRGIGGGVTGGYSTSRTVIGKLVKELAEARRLEAVRVDGHGHEAEAAARGDVAVPVRTCTCSRVLYVRKSFLWSPTLLAISTSPRLRALVRLTWVP